MADELSEARTLAKFYAKRSGAPMSACVTLAQGILECVSMAPQRNAMARVLGLRLLGESLGAIQRGAGAPEKPEGKDKPSALRYDLKEPPKADAV